MNETSDIYGRLRQYSLLLLHFFRILKRDRAHNHVLFCLGHLILNFKLLSIALDAHALLLVLEAFHVVTNRGAFVAYEVAALPAMMPSSQEIEFLLANFALFLHRIGHPLHRWQVETISCSALTLAQREDVRRHCESLRGHGLRAHRPVQLDLRLTQQQIGLRLQHPHVALRPLLSSAEAADQVVALGAGAGLLGAEG